MPSNPEARLFLPNDLNVMARVSDISQSGAAITSEHAREGQVPTRPPGGVVEGRARKRADLRLCVHASACGRFLVGDPKQSIYRRRGPLTA